MTFGPTGNIVIKLLRDIAAGSGVNILLKSPVKKLLLDNRGKIAGVLAQTDKGPLQVKAQSVIITTGGYGGNKSLLKKYCPNFGGEARYFGIKELTGDGLLMATDIGAATDGLGLPHYWGGHYYGANVLNLINQRPEAIWINKNGERFCDETILFDMGTRGNVFDRLPGKVSYTLFDEQIKNNIIAEGLVGAQVALRWSPPDTIWASVMEKLPAEAKKDKVKISNSIEEIARWMGTPTEKLKATVDQYNADCGRGYDAMFLKDRRYLDALQTPPYYAVKFQQTLLDTAGGIKTNHRMEILDHDDKTIPGLYAAGVCVGGYLSATYCYMLAGTMFGFALNSGRIAAENAVEYSNGKKRKRKK